MPSPSERWPRAVPQHPVASRHRGRGRGTRGSPPHPPFPCDEGRSHCWRRDGGWRVRSRRAPLRPLVADARAKPRPARCAPCPSASSASAARPEPRPEWRSEIRLDCRSCAQPPPRMLPLCRTPASRRTASDAPFPTMLALARPVWCFASRSRPVRGAREGKHDVSNKRRAPDAPLQLP